MTSSTPHGSGPAVAHPPLRRALGRWDLTAIGINQVIGSAIFLMPSQVAAHVGTWSPLAFLGAGLATLIIGLCFAEVGSRFDATGGPYLYARRAFGRFVGFEVGWMAWFTRATSQAAVSVTRDRIKIWPRVDRPRRVSISSWRTTRVRSGLQQQRGLPDLEEGRRQRFRRTRNGISLDTVRRECGHGER